jgi:hypothetical protein
MAAGVTNIKGETQEHARLKRLAFIWAQAHGFSACAMEVTAKMSVPRRRSGLSSTAKSDRNNSDL